jgi:Na+/H+ antiporter NhaD/arsenite permease-like protein
VTTGLAIAIFCLTYALIVARRLRWLPIGRPAGALLGAVLMVACGVIAPEESFRAVDHSTIVLLLGMMIITAYLDEAAFFDWVVGGIIRVCATPWRLLALVSITSAALSALLVNDTVCLFMTPIVVLTCARTRLPMGPFLMAVATSANIGSAATLVGNPQNMIIGAMSQLPFAAFLARSGAAALVGVIINLALLWLYYGRALPAVIPPVEAVTREAKRGEIAKVCAVLVAVVAAFFAGAHLGYTTLAGATALIVLERVEPRRAFARVDWALLVFFCALFVVVKAFALAVLPDGGQLTPEHARQATAWLDLSTAGGVARFTALVVVGSNLVSNVPLVLLSEPVMKGLAQPELGWVLLAFVSTVAGNLTLIGSVANIIVAEGAKEHYTLGFVEYLKFGVVSTLLVLAAGVPVIWLVTRALGG